MAKTLDALKSLKNQHESISQRYDRFGNAADKKQLEELEAEIASFPPEILREEATPSFIRAVEEYILDQVQQHIDGQHIKTLPAISGTPTNPQQRVVYWRDQLRGFGMSDEEFEIAVMLALDLPSYRQQSPSGEKVPRLPNDFSVHLQQYAALLIDEIPTDAIDLSYDVEGWLKEEPEKMLGAKNHNVVGLMRAAFALKKIGVTEEKIVRLVRTAKTKRK